MELQAPQETTRQAVLAGQDRILDTPVGLPLDLLLGQAMERAVLRYSMQRSD